VSHYRDILSLTSGQGVVVDVTKVVIVVIFFGILAALGSAVIPLMKGGRSEQTARSLTWRIGLSVGLFVLLFVLAALGLIEPHGVEP